VKETVADPWPVVGDAAIQLLSAETDHVQSRAVEIETEPEPPVGGKGVVGTLPTLIWHLAAVGAETDVDARLHPASGSAESSAKTSLIRRSGERIRFIVSPC
jgi:hypothetical protein